MQNDLKQAYATFKCAQTKLVRVCEDIAALCAKHELTLADAGAAAHMFLADVYEQKWGTGAAEAVGVALAYATAQLAGHTPAEAAAMLNKILRQKMN